MRLCSIASGSSGNCIFAGTEHTSVLVDAGLSGKKTEQGLGSIGFSVRDIDALFVTHEHADHIKGLGVLARKYEIPIYATQGTIDAILGNASTGKIPDGLFHAVTPDVPITLKDLTVEPFRISHDAADPVGYRMTSGGKSMAVATDMGTYTEETVRHLKDLNAVLLEANHDVNMLECGRYPYYLKVRIMSDRGHLSNEASGKLLGEILHDGMQYVMLGHLSKENNYPELAYETVCSEVTLGDNPYKSSDFPISVAGRDTVSRMVEF